MFWFVTDFYTTLINIDMVLNNWYIWIFLYNCVMSYGSSYAWWRNCTCQSEVLAVLCDHLFVFYTKAFLISWDLYSFHKSERPTLYLCLFRIFHFICLSQGELCSALTFLWQWSDRVCELRCQCQMDCVYITNNI